MDGWVDGWVDGWNGGWMHGRMGKWTEQVQQSRVAQTLDEGIELGQERRVGQHWMDAWMHACMHGWMDRWTDGRSRCNRVILRRHCMKAWNEGMV
eukprot:364650-Chlamydomonas_euryale.AAC.3